MFQLLRNLISFALVSNFTTTLNTAQNLSALTFQMGANETWVVKCQYTTQCSGTGGVKYAVSAPSGAVIEGWLQTSTSAITTLSFQRLTAISTLTSTAAHTVATTPAPDVLQFQITNGSTAGGCVLQVASATSGQTTTIFAGSFMTATRVS